MNDLISIVIPAYNIEDYLSKTLDSVLSQTYANIEVIVVNDGSEDGTREVIDRYATSDSRVRAIHKENGGVTSARLRGVTEAQGEWIGFVDGDDYIEPDMYERLLSNAFKEKADISHCGYRMVFPHGHVDYYYNTGRYLQQDRESALGALLDGAFVEPGLCNKLYHKHLFDSLLHEAIMDMSIRHTEDLLMNYYLFREAERTVYEDICPYHYVLRQNSAATSSVSTRRLHDCRKVLQILLKETEGEQSIHVTVKKRYIHFMIQSATSADKQNRVVIEFRNQVLGELRKELKDIIMDHSLPAKLKGMAMWAGISPTSYTWVHQVYVKLRGFDKIYSLDK